MRKIILPGTDITTTVMGYGCGGLMRATSRRRRSALLNEAYDNGIRHFDVARMYGLGAAEAELGKFIKGKRDGLVVASKYGIEVAAQHWALVAMQGIVRRIIALSPVLRGLVRRKAGAMYQPRKYDVETAKKSLHESLKALGTDYLDIFLLHEPSLEDVTDPGILEYLERAREQGLIRAYGVAGYPETLLPICGEMPGLIKVLQIPNDIVSRQMRLFDLSGSATLTFSPYSSALDVIIQHIATSEQAAKRWSAAAGCDMTDRNNVAGYLLSYCLRENNGGVVLFSSTNTQRIASAAKLAAEAEGRQDYLQNIMNLVDREIVATTSSSVC